jgi:tRNA (mo5U34)-methyltransferase
MLSKYNFYHVIPLTDTLRTAGNTKFVPSQNNVLKAMRMMDWRGKRVLDIGCRDGLFSFEAEKLGAKEIIAIDNSLSKAATEFLIPYFGSKVKMKEINLLDVCLDKFGKLYHHICRGLISPALSVLVPEAYSKPFGR